jgi:predicted dehydrogenase
LATLYASCAAEIKQIRLTLFTPSREICLEGWNLLIRDEDPADQQCDAFAEEVAAFLDAVRTGRRGAILSDLTDAIESQRVIDALVRASRSGRWEHVASCPLPR